MISLQTIRMFASLVDVKEGNIVTKRISTEENIANLQVILTAFDNMLNDDITSITFTFKGLKMAYKDHVYIESNGLSTEYLTLVCYGDDERTRVMISDKIIDGKSNKFPIISVF